MEEITIKTSLLTLYVVLEDFREEDTDFKALASYYGSIIGTPEMGAAFRVSAAAECKFPHHMGIPHPHCPQRIKTIQWHLHQLAMTLWEREQKLQEAA
ncbi:unnamed protein product, partial [Protopolystoma xenopodis]